MTKEKRDWGQTFSAGANIAAQLADLSQAKAYRSVDFQKSTVPVTENTQDHAAGMSTATAYDGQQQTAVSSENGMNADGKPILSKKEKRLLQRQRNYDNFQ
jgi:hypothetical protein